MGHPCLCRDQGQRQRTGVSVPHERWRREQQVPHRAWRPVRNDIPWLVARFGMTEGGLVSRLGLMSCQLVFCALEQVAHGLDYGSRQQDYYCYQG
jgi:hypothetical protein